MVTCPRCGCELVDGQHRFPEPPFTVDSKGCIWRLGVKDRPPTARGRRGTGEPEVRPMGATRPPPGRKRTRPENGGGSYHPRASGQIVPLWWDKLSPQVVVYDSVSEPTSGGIDTPSGTPQSRATGCPGQPRHRLGTSRGSFVAPVARCSSGCGAATLSSRLHSSLGLSWGDSALRGRGVKTSGTNTRRQR